MTSENILKIAAKALDDKKGENISVLKIEEISSLAEYFLIATATSSTHVRALTDETEQKLKEAGVLPHHTEGRSTGWNILDYGSVIVHIFTPHDREYYDLDRMWADAEIIDLESILS